MNKRQDIPRPTSFKHWYQVRDGVITHKLIVVRETAYSIVVWRPYRTGPDSEGWLETVRRRSSWAEYYPSEAEACRACRKYCEKVIRWTARKVRNLTELFDAQADSLATADHYSI